MAKYKPKLFKIAEELAKAGKGRAAIGAGVIEFLLALGGAYYTGGVTYSCGNPRCDEVIYVRRDEERPLVCSRCGEEIDWAGIKTRIIKVCPTCNKQYDEEANFCPYHIPKVALVPKEVSIVT